MSSGSEDEAEEQRAELIVSLRRSLKANPYNYDSHILFIKTLKEATELEQLRHARTKMAEVFPLTEELWLDWIGDEIDLAETTADQHKIIALFDRAVADYLSPGVWQRYCAWMASSYDEADPSFAAAAVRGVFDKAVAAVGQHFTAAGEVWATMYTFELGLLEDGPESGTEAQQTRVHTLLRRWAAAPIDPASDGGVAAQVEAWARTVADGTVPDDIRSGRRAADAAREAYATIEAELAVAPPPRHDAFAKLISVEAERQSTPDRMILAYERAIVENPLSVTFWHGYGQFCDSALAAIPALAETAVRVHRRSVRNCPWVSSFWIRLAHASERVGQPAKPIYDEALRAGFSLATDFLEIWASYAEHVRRAVPTEPADARQKAVEEWTKVLDRGESHLKQYYGRNGDPSARLGLYRARVQATVFKDVAAARATYDALETDGHASQAHVWLAHARLEQALGTEATCRATLTEAVQKVSDDPEAVCSALLTFERDAGSLSDFDAASRKVEARLKIIGVRREKAAQKEAQKKTAGPVRGGTSKETAERPRKDKRKRSGKEETLVSAPAAAAAAPPTTGPPHAASSDSDISRPEKRKRSGEDEVAGSSGAPEEPSAPKRRNIDEGDAKSMDTDAEGSKPQKSAPQGEGGPTIDPSTYPRTVFIKNLSFAVEEAQIEEVFSVCGTIDQIRLVRNRAGKSKGFAYVQFTSESAVESALAMDRHKSAPLDFRPVYVNRCEERDPDAPAPKPEPRYSDQLERNKLYVSGLSFSVTEEELRDFFGTFGELVDVRLATKRSGASKGYAFVEYKSEDVATRAILGGNNHTLKGRAFSVALSNPPKKGAQASQPGGGHMSLSSSGTGGGMFRPRVMVAERKRPGLGVSRQTVARQAVGSAGEREDGDAAPKPDNGGGAKKDNAFFASLFAKKT